VGFHAASNITSLVHVGYVGWQVMMLIKQSFDWIGIASKLGIVTSHDVQGINMRRPDRLELRILVLEHLYPVVTN
jgi:hypothetical protein